MDGQRLHARVRGLPAHRRGAGRSVRAAADVPRRHRAVHRRVGARRAGALDRRADRRTGAPGPRRGDRRAADAHAPERGVPGGQARSRARHLVGHRRPRGRHGAAGRRRDHRGHLVAVDLLGQRPGRARAAAAPAAAWSRATARRPPRPAGRRARHRRPVRHRLRHRARERAGVGSETTSSARTSSVRCCSSPSACGSAARRRRCSRCGSSARAPSPPPRACRWRCRSGSSARSSCWPSSSRPCGATGRSRPACARCPGPACR